MLDSLQTKYVLSLLRAGDKLEALNTVRDFLKETGIEKSIKIVNQLNFIKQ